ncbi:MAG: hypothetical protein Q8O89_00450 [Nanoarchaeota archaeon]|nr:hypothetical protein [Nanoarchaeota archaeon]
MGCQFCEEFEQGYFCLGAGSEKFNRIIFDTDNFVVFPSLGQIVEGYLLIASKKHHISIAALPENLFSELKYVVDRTKIILAENYQKPILFEHGPASEREKGGCCVMHAHIHAVPVEIDETNILKRLSKHFSSKKISSLEELKENKAAPYLFFEDKYDNKFTFQIPEVIPSQYIRQVIAHEIGQPEKWDWHSYYGIDEMKNTLEKLRT